MQSIVMLNAVMLSVVLRGVVVLCFELFLKTINSGSEGLNAVLKVVKDRILKQETGKLKSLKLSKTNTWVFTRGRSLKNVLR
jgi:hypothetical protein